MDETTTAAVSSDEDDADASVAPKKMPLRARKATAGRTMHAVEEEDEEVEEEDEDVESMLDD